MRVEPPLHVTAREPASGAPLVQLRVDCPNFWNLDSVTVLRTPDGRLEGSSHGSAPQALGVIKHHLGAPGTPVGLDRFEAYVIPSMPFDAALLGAATIRYQLRGEEVSAPHSPDLATLPVRCLREEPPEGGGQWMSVQLMRPFVPFEMPDGEALREVRDRMRKGKHVPHLKAVYRLAPDDPRLAARAGAKRPAPSELDSEPQFLTGRQLLGEPPLAGALPSALPHQAELSEAWEAASSAAAPRHKKRQRWFDRTGNVVVLKPTATDGFGYQPVLLVITGKKNQGNAIVNGSPRYVLVAPLLGGGAEECYHVSQLEALAEALPRIYEAHTAGRGATEGGVAYMLRKILAAVRKQHERSAHHNSVEQLWARMVPNGGPWEERVAELARLEAEEGA